MKRVIILAAALLLGCKDDDDGINEPAVAQVDQQNVLDGTLSAQGIGRFVLEPGGQAPDHQSAQTFTVGMSGQLIRVRVPLINLNAATSGATMSIVQLSSVGMPDDSRALGEVTVAASALPTTEANRNNPDTWVSFNFTSANINVTAGQQLAFILRSTSATEINYVAETTSGYALGTGFRRNRATTTTWTQHAYDYGFQTYVRPN